MSLSNNVPVDELFYLKNAKEGRAVKLLKGRYSPPLQVYNRGQPLSFGVKGPLAGGLPSFRTLTQVTWPEGNVDEVAVLISATGNGADLQLSGLAVENSIRVFPLRSIRVMNFSGQKLFAQIGSFRGDLAAGPASAIPYPEVKTEPGRTGRFKVGIGRLVESGDSEIVFSGWADAWPTARTLLLILPPPTGSDKPEVVFVVDTPPPPR